MSQYPDTNNSIWNRTQDTYYDDIQTAVNESIPYDTICLPSGEIVDTIYIDKHLTIAGDPHIPTVFKQTVTPSEQSIYITGDVDVAIDNLYFDGVSAAIVIEDSPSGNKVISGIKCNQSDHFVLIGNSTNIHIHDSHVLNYEDMKDTWKIAVINSGDVKIDGVDITYSESQDICIADMIYTEGSTTIKRVNLHGARTGIWVAGNDVTINDSIIVTNMNSTPGSLLTNVLVTTGGNNVAINDCALFNNITTYCAHITNMTSCVIDATRNYWGEQIIYDDKDITTSIRINNNGAGDVMTSPYWKDGPYTDLVHFEYE